MRRIIGANVPAEDSVISYDLLDFPKISGIGKTTLCSTAVRTSCITSTWSAKSVALAHHNLLRDAADPLLRKKLCDSHNLFLN